ncbi:hypothetical protein Y032_0036g3228 [Ancylostoma ceylanicum]|uniref:Uncharacterized protein n=1 Tax=Ancylostoma ceylanicum TaxID=53326 RepID=A0A016UJP8_9BILA|nr:hypothetical protein Y032_0036g3228 [Ancylostoma ceylanicum]
MDCQEERHHYYENDTQGARKMSSRVNKWGQWKQGLTSKYLSKKSKISDPLDYMASAKHIGGTSCAKTTTGGAR